MKSYRFGSIGWSYDDWKGPFYAADTRPEKMLAALSQVLSAIEIDASFFGLPRMSTLQNWMMQTTERFRFCAKAPRALTHEKRLAGNAGADARIAAEHLREGLGEKLAHILVQLPPDFAAGERRHVERFFTEAGDGPWAVEFRHASWLQTDIPAFLEERGVVLATTEKLDFGHPPRYLRLLGDEGAFARFHERQLDRRPELDIWAERLKQSEGERFVFVRNYFEGHAPASLFYLMEKLGITPPTPPGQQQMSLF